MMTIGLDIGTTSVCGILMDNASKRILRSISRDNTAAIESALSYEKLQDPLKIFEICRGIYEELLSVSSDITAMGITGQMHGILYISSSGKSLSPLYTWQDERGRELINGRISYTEHITKATGYQMAAGYGWTTHFFNKTNRLIPDGAYKICTIHDYVAMRFAGLCHPEMHISDAASLGLFELKTLEPDRSAVNRLGLDAELLPHIHKSMCFIGQTADNVNVAVAVGDNQASVFGTLPDNETAVLNIGTGSQVSVVTDKYTEKSNVEFRPYLNKDYLITGCALCGGYAYSILKNFYQSVLEMCGVSPPDDLYRRMENTATAVYGLNDTLTVDTRFCGTRSNPDMRGKIENIGMNNFHPSHLTSGVLEGIVAELHELYLSFNSLLPQRIEKLMGAGNALRKNKLLQKMATDRFGMPVILAPYDEEAAAGAAFAAASIK